MPPQADWHIEDIKAELRKRFGSLSALCREWGVTRSSISNVLAQPDRSRRMERRIAAALDRTPHEIWPSRWTPKNTPISHRVDRSPSRTAAAAQRAKAVAA